MLKKSYYHSRDYILYIYLYLCASFFQKLFILKIKIMKNFLSFFGNVKKILDSLWTMQSQLAQVVYLVGELVSRIKLIEEDEKVF